jgi:RNA polymerase sigma-70 factor (ECF subfamily)
VTAEAIALAVASQGAATDEGAGRVAMLFERHHLRLYRLARRMSDTSESARDLVQETFLRAARSEAAVPIGESAEEAWLVRVLVNLCRDEWRRLSRRERRRVFDVPKVQASDPETALIARATVWKALRRLPPRRRAALVMYELEGTTIPEIAQLLGVSAVTVRWHLSRGRRELANVIRGDLPMEKPS